MDEEHERSTAANMSQEAVERDSNNPSLQRQQQQEARPSETKEQNGRQRETGSPGKFEGFIMEPIQT